MLIIGDYATRGPYAATVEVWHGETWYDELDQVVHADGSPFNVTNYTFELIVRPTFDHDTRLILLTTAGSAGILKLNAAQGLLAFFKSQSAVELALPTSNDRGWDQFLRMSWTDADLGAVKQILWTGPLIVHPARDDS